MESTPKQLLTLSSTSSSRATPSSPIKVKFRSVMNENYFDTDADLLTEACTAFQTKLKLDARSEDSSPEHVAYERLEIKISDDASPCLYTPPKLAKAVISECKRNLESAFESADENASLLARVDDSETSDDDENYVDMFPNRFEAGVAYKQLERNLDILQNFCLNNPKATQTLKNDLTVLLAKCTIALHC